MNSKAAEPIEPNVDLVGSAMDQWRPEVPQEDIQIMEICLRLQRAATVGANAIRTTHQASGLHAGDFDILATIYRAKIPTNSAKLREMLLMSKGGVSARVSKLINSGYIVENNADSDGRSKVLSLTELGTTALLTVLPHHLATERELLSNLSDEQKQTFLELLRLLPVKN